MSLLRTDTPQNIQPIKTSPRVTPITARALATPEAPAARAADSSAAPAGDLRARLSRLNAQVGDVQRRDIDAQKADATLERVGELLAEVQSLLPTQEASASEIDAARTRIDELLGQVHAAADASLAGVIRPTNPGQEVTNLGAGVERVSARASLKPGESLDAIVDIIASAHRAGLYLSFGGDDIDLPGTTGRFELSITAAGFEERVLSFASGTTITAVTNAINSFTDITGLSATNSGTGIRLDSKQLGVNDFITVQIVSAGGINDASPDAGVYQLMQYNTHEADPSRGQTFRNLDEFDEQVKGQGRALQAIINGGTVVATGDRLDLRTNDLRAALSITNERAQTVGSFRAFTISQAAEPDAPDEPGAIGIPDAEALVNDPDARDALGRAITGIGDRRDAIERFRRETIFPELNSLNDEIAQAMLGGAGAVRRALTPERAAALLGRRT